LSYEYLLLGIKKQVENSNITLGVAKKEFANFKDNVEQEI